MRYLEYICSAGKIHQPRCAFVEITDMLPSPSIAVSSEIFYKNEETLCKYFGVVLSLPTSPWEAGDSEAPIKHKPVKNSDGRHVFSGNS